MLSLLLACSDGNAPTAPDSPIVLESSDLLSGGEGMLRSPDFEDFELAAAVDTAGETVANRWTNFRVEVDGTEVDSWRVAPDSIAFRVPLGLSGTAEVGVYGDAVVPTSFSVRRLGLVDAFRYDACSYILPPQASGGVRLVGEGGRVLFSTELAVCSATSSGEDYIVGNGSVLPPIMGSFTPIDAASSVFASGAELDMIRTYAPGYSNVSGTTILERPAAQTDPPSPPDLWRARVGADIELLDPVSCTVYPEITTFAVLEVSDGVCLTIEDQTWLVRRDDEEVFELSYLLSSSAPPRFVVSATGRSVVIGIVDEASTPTIPVFDAAGQLDYTIDDFGANRLETAIFADDGDLYLAGGPSNGGTSLQTVVERRDATTGRLIERRSFAVRTVTEPGPVAMTLVEDRLWVVEQIDVEGLSYSGNYGVLRVLDPGDLSVERSIYLDKPRVGGYPAGLVEPTPGSVLVPDPSGGRAYVVSYWDQRLVGFIVDVY